MRRGAPLARYRVIDEQELLGGSVPLAAPVEPAEYPRPLSGRPAATRRLAIVLAFLLALLAIAALVYERTGTPALGQHPGLVLRRSEHLRPRQLHLAARPHAAAPVRPRRRRHVHAPIRLRASAAAPRPSVPRARKRSVAPASAGRAARSARVPQRSSSAASAPSPQAEFGFER